MVPEVVAKKKENFLLLGANCKEDCEPIRRYVHKLADEMNEVEKKTFSANVDGTDITVSLSFEMFPNDRKYLAFLAFPILQNISRHSLTSTKMILVMLLPCLGLKPQTNGNLVGYAQRISVASAVAKTKGELGSSSSHLKPANIRQKVTSFIAQKSLDRNFPPPPC